MPTKTKKTVSKRVRTYAIRIEDRTDGKGQKFVANDGLYDFVFSLAPGEEVRVGDFLYTTYMGRQDLVERIAEAGLTIKNFLIRRDRQRGSRWYLDKDER